MSGTEKGIDKKLVFIIKEGMARRAFEDINFKHDLSSCHAPMLQSFDDNR
jgi:hypothetical protein